MACALALIPVRAVPFLNMMRRDEKHDRIHGRQVNADERHDSW
jgi:hypothetical protein